MDLLNTSKKCPRCNTVVEEYIKAEEAKREQIREEKRKKEASKEQINEIMSELDIDKIECNNCHTLIPKDSKFCTSCGNEIIENKEKELTLRELKISNILTAVSILLIFGNNLLWAIGAYLIRFNIKEEIIQPFFYLALSPIMPVIGFVLLIFVRIRYPQNKFAKATLTVSIIVFILIVIATIWFIHTCLETLSSCPG